MSSISGINNSLYSSYSHLSSGKKLNSAADGAAELSIVQKMDAQTRGYNVGTNNMQSGKDLLNVSDAALGHISDYLQSIRELSVQASNSAIYSASDLSAIQDQIDQYKQGISDIASQTQFNTKNLLDGSNTSFDMATNANGSTTTINTADATLQALGIDGYDVTGNFDIDTIDKALEKVNSARSKGGAQYNALTYAINNNSYTALNTTAASSRLEDLDYPKAISDLKKQQLLQTYTYMMQKKQQEHKASQFNLLFR